MEGYTSFEFERRKRTNFIRINRDFLSFYLLLIFSKSCFTFVLSSSVPKVLLSLPFFHCVDGSTWNYLRKFVKWEGRRRCGDERDKEVEVNLNSIHPTTLKLPIFDVKFTQFYLSISIFAYTQCQYLIICHMIKQHEEVSKIVFMLNGAKIQWFFSIDIILMPLKNSNRKVKNFAKGENVKKKIFEKIHSLPSPLKSNCVNLLRKSVTLRNSS